MSEEIRVPVDDWPEKAKQLHREGLTVTEKRTSDDGLEYLVTVEPRLEQRLEGREGAYDHRDDAA